MTNYIERDCTFEHAGRTFESGGAVVTAEYIVVYLHTTGDNRQVVVDWHGNVLGSYRVLLSWRTPRSFVSSRMYSIECFVDGVRYVGRGAGDGMILKAKRSPRQGRSHDTN